MKDYPLDASMRDVLSAHVRLYQETNGRDGPVVVENGRKQDALLLTTTGRRSGEPRTAALYYGRDGDSWLVVASLAGYDHPPQWYLNLCAEPRVEVQVGRSASKRRQGRRTPRSGRGCGRSCARSTRCMRTTRRRRSARSPWSSSR
jgi:deazaflavin-dependent oxidoreductase (nitroreductase family)